MNHTVQEYESCLYWNYDKLRKAFRIDDYYLENVLTLTGPNIEQKNV